MIQRSFTSQIFFQLKYVSPTGKVFENKALNRIWETELTYATSGLYTLFTTIFQ